MDFTINQKVLIQAMEQSNLAHSISRVDGDRELIYVNQAFCDETGYSREEVVGKNCRFLQGPNTNPNAVMQIRDALEKSESIDIEILNYKKNGTAFWNRFRMSPVYDDNGKVIAFIGIQSNVTEVREGQRLKEERRQLEALGRLTGNISHEIKNAIQPVKLMTEVLLDWQNMEPESVDRCMKILKDNAMVADEVTQDMLCFSRRSDTDVVSLQTHDLQDNVSRFVKNILHDGVTFSMNAQDSPYDSQMYVHLQPNHLYQLIMNMISNALYAMNDKGKLTLHWGFKEVAGSLSEELAVSAGRYLCIGLEDDGCGMDDKVMCSVFDPFYSTKTPGDGTGLGLSLAYRYVKEWGGTIDVQSEVGQGSCFTLYLPLYDE